MPRIRRGMLNAGTYHILVQGNNSQLVFREQWDYQNYMRLLGTHITKHELKLHHFVLMPNHLHLVLGITDGKALSKAMQGLNVAYAAFYRKRYRYSGHLWQGRFKSSQVDRDNLLLACGRFVELNPIRASLVKHPGEYAWSSYRVYAEGINHAFISLNPSYKALGATPQERQFQYRRFFEEGSHRSPEFPERFDSFGFPAMRIHRGRPRKPRMAVV